MASSSVRSTGKNGTPPPPARVNGAAGRRRSSPPAETAPAAVLDPDDDDDDLDLTAANDAADLADAAEDTTGQTYKGNGEDFWEWLTRFSTDDWQFMMGYLYRTAPTIDRRAAGRPSNIRKYSVPFDQDTVMHDEGSGGYRLDLCRRNPSTGRSTRIAQHYFQIMNLDFPPRVPAGDWVDQPENDVWKWAKPKLEAAAQMAAIYPNGTPPDPNKIFDTVLSGIERLNSGKKDEKEGGSVAAAAITALSNMTTKMMEQQQARPADESSKVMLDFLKDELRETRKEMRELRESRKTEEKPKTLLEQIKEIVPAISEIRDIFGLKSKGAGTATNWGDVVTEVIDKLSENAPLIYDMVKGRNAEPGNIGAQWRLGPTKKAEPKPAAAAEGTSSTTTAAPPASEPAAAQEAELPEADQKKYQAILAKWGQLITNVAPFLVDHFRANLTGYEFRDWFISRQGMNNYSAFKLDVTAEDLTALAMLHATLNKMLQPPEKLLVFMTEFLTEPGAEPPGTVTEE